MSANPILLNTSIEEVERKYDEYKSKDPYVDIFPALLNSADIYDYVVTTGLVSPFDPTDIKKPASFALKLQGEYLYWNNDGEKVKGKLENLKTLDDNGKKILRIVPNSLIFVLLDTYFRFPDYIAARFNLKIQHIHQGLLVGTGPLVDPGFVGRLCIPVHNLTNNEYSLEVNETFIWMEFTKISSNVRWQNDLAQNSTRSGVYKTYSSKLKDNMGIEDYIHAAHKNGSISSSFQGFFASSKSTMKEYDTRINEGITEVKGLNRFFNFAIIASIVATTVSVASTLYAVVNIHYKTIDYVKASDEKQQKEYQIILDKDKEILRLRNDFKILNERMKVLELTKNKRRK